MTLNTNAFYSALRARDPRFDGLFFVGVTSTKIYCRPICPAKTPKRANCHFFASAVAAEMQRFRPCLRCRPELAPGSAPVDDAQRIAQLIVSRLEQGLLNEKDSLEDIAAQFELSSRQIRRILRKELAVSPIELMQTRRLLLAKQLLTETRLPVTEVAFASGFASLRRFNDAFSKRYGMPPSRLRRKAQPGAAATDSITLQLTYRPPYDWDGILNFLAQRTLKSIEQIGKDSAGDFYRRTVRLGACKGWIEVRHKPQARALLVTIAPTLIPAMPVLLNRLRHLFDLGARPDVIAAHLRQSSLLAASIDDNPGLRVPGASDGFELAVRAILGQQVTVKAATTLAGRFAAAFGEPIATPFAELEYLCPTPQRVAQLKADAIAKLGIIGNRARSIIALAQAIVAGRLKLEAGTRPEPVIAQLITLPGLGAWTAHYIALRALRWPDAFPKEDVALRKQLGGVTAKEAEKLAEAWRPWRGYATLHVWRQTSQQKNAQQLLKKEAENEYGTILHHDA